MYRIHGLHTTSARSMELALPFFLRPTFDSNRLIASCNGWLFIIHENPLDYRLSLYNPTTRASLKITLPPSLSRYSTWGFGYDCHGDEYKIVGFTSRGTNDALVYRLKSDSWIQSQIDVDNQFQTPNFYNHGVLASNHLHWYVLTQHALTLMNNLGSSAAGAIYIDAILSFDLHDEKWNFVPVPNSVGLGKYEIKELGVLKECLCCLTRLYKEDYFINCRELWVMKEYGVGESWTKLFNVPQGFIPSSPDVCCWREEEEEKEECNKFLLRGEQSLVWYDPCKHTIENVELVGELGGEHDFRLGAMVIWAESLVNPFNCEKSRKQEE